MRTRRFCALLLLVGALLSGCWDKLEVEDQLFPVTMAIDKGERSRYKITVRIPISAALKSGNLGGQSQREGSVDMMSAEADTVSQAMYILNASVARRITLRHLRAIAVGEDLAREGLRDLFSQLYRNAEVHETAVLYVAHGSATAMLATSRPTGEFNPGHINEGLLLVQKGLHMAPPIRLQHVIVRSGSAGNDPFTAVAGSNRRVLGTQDGKGTPRSAIAGELDRIGKNPMEIAGTAVLRDDRLAGFLTVDETQGLLALRGEMGKAYVTLPDPLNRGEMITIRYQQENKPSIRAAVTSDGPRITVRLLFEGEVLTGPAEFRDTAQRQRIEQAAAAFMKDVIDGVITKTIAWQADPVGFGLQFRSRFATWDQWMAFRWRDQISRMKVQVTCVMRIRRFGLIHDVPPTMKGEK